ncbi:LysR family transcriptional regulator [Streptomyces sp. M19]
MDQLRTLLAVREAGTALGAARLLGREQSSVQKQLDRMNRHFGALCGEPWCSARAQPERALHAHRRDARRARPRHVGELAGGGGRLRPAAGQPADRGLHPLHPRVPAERRGAGHRGVRGRRVELRVEHVRTRDLLDRLGSKELDLVCGSVLTQAGRDDHLDGFEVMEWRRSGLSLVTNLTEDELPGPALAARPAGAPARRLLRRADPRLPARLVRRPLPPGADHRRRDRHRPVRP